MLVVVGARVLDSRPRGLALERGAEVAASRSREKLASAARDLGDRVRTVAVDVGREEDVERLFAEVTEIDHIVTSAVDAAYQPVKQLDLTAARKVVDSKLVERCFSRNTARRAPARGGR